MIQIIFYNQKLNCIQCNQIQLQLKQIILNCSSPKFKVSRFNPHREHLKTQIAHTSLLTLKPRASLPKIQKNSSQISQRSEIPLLKMQSMGSPLSQSYLLEMEKVYCVWHSETGIVGGEQKKHNQDALIVQNVNDYQLFMVCDGHGNSGHLVSNYVLNTLIQQIEQGMQRNQYMLQYNTQLHKTVIKGAFAKTSSLLEQSSLPIIRSGCIIFLLKKLNQDYLKEIFKFNQIISIFCLFELQVYLYKIYQHKIKICQLKKQQNNFIAIQYMQLGFVTIIKYSTSRFRRFSVGILEGISNILCKCW